MQRSLPSCICGMGYPLCRNSAGTALRVQKTSAGLTMWFRSACSSVVHKGLSAQFSVLRGNSFSPCHFFLNLPFKTIFIFLHRQHLDILCVVVCGDAPPPSKENIIEARTAFRSANAAVSCSQCGKVRQCVTARAPSRSHHTHWLDHTHTVSQWSDRSAERRSTCVCGPTAGGPRAAGRVRRRPFEHS